MSRFDAAVVGSGPNGLCAAIVLAQAGLRVGVYEGAETLGGGARTEELTLPGFRHDVCSAVHPMAPVTPFLRTLNLGIDWIEPDVPLAHPLDGGAVMQEHGIAATARGLGRDGAAWSQLFTPFVRDFEGLVQDSFSAPGVPRNPLAMARFGREALRSAGGLARSWFQDPEARALWAGTAAHALLPFSWTASSSIGLMLATAAHARGWPFPRGGAQSISDALLRHFRALGGVVVQDGWIQTLEQVETDGPILFETSVRAVAAIAADALPASYRRRLLSYRYGVGVFKVDWALDGPIPWSDPRVARAATVHCAGTLQEIEASEAAAWSGEFCAQPYVLLTQPSLFDPTRAPPGKHTAWGYCHVPAGSDTDYTQAIEDQVERFAPGFRDRVIGRFTRHAAAYERYNPTYVGGDPMGGAASWDQLLTRPTVSLDPYSTPNPRLYLCSAATPPGGGIHGMCGVNAARSALRRWRPQARIGS